MELKKRNMINYTGTAHFLLRQGFFNSCIGRYMNRDLYYSLGPVERNQKQNSYKIDQNRVNAANQLAIKYNKSRSLGELLVNFSQSNDVNNLVDLRTFVYFAVNAINQDTSQNYMENYRVRNEESVVQAVTDEQLSIFYNNAFASIERQFDFFTAATLLQAPKVVELANVEHINAVAFMVFEQLCKVASNSDEIQKGIKKGNLSEEQIERLRSEIMLFDEVVYMIFGLFSCSQAHEMYNSSNSFISKEALIEAAIDALDAVELDFNPSNNLEDASIYLMLSYIFEIVPDIASSKKFKNKKDQHKILKKIHSITTKPLKITEAEEYANFIGFSRDMVVYLNYLAFQNFNVMFDKVMLGKSGFGASTKYKIQNNLVTILENESFMPPYLLRDMNNAVYRPSRGNEHNSSAVVSDFFVKTYTGTLSRNNLIFVIQNYGLNQFKEFMTDPRWAHLLQPAQQQTSIAQDTEHSTQGGVSQNVGDNGPVNNQVMQQPAQQNNVNQNVQPNMQGNESVNNQAAQQVQQNDVAMNAGFNPQGNVQMGVQPNMQGNEPVNNQAAQQVQQNDVAMNAGFNPQGNVQMGVQPNMQGNEPVNNQAAQQVQQNDVAMNAGFNPQGNVQMGVQPNMQDNEPVNNQAAQQVQQNDVAMNAGFNPQGNVQMGVQPNMQDNVQGVQQPVQQAPLNNVNQNVVPNVQGDIVRNYVTFTVSTGPISLF